MAGAFNPFGQQFESGGVRALEHELEYLRIERETAKAVIAQLAGNGPADVLYMHPYDVGELLNRPSNNFVDLYLSGKAEPGNNEMVIGSSSIRVKQTPLMPEGVGLKELDRREAEMKARAAARAELANSLPMMIKILNNPEFVRGVMESGFQIDAEAVLKVIREAAGWRYKS